MKSMPSSGPTLLTRTEAMAYLSSMTANTGGTSRRTIPSGSLSCIRLPRKADTHISHARTSDILEAKELNGNEDIKGSADFKGKELTFNVGPFGMKTFFVRLKDYGKEVSTVKSVPVELPFNAKAASYNAFHTDANFDGKGNSYAADLLPGTLAYRGVEFTLPDGTVENAVKCSNDTVSLPAGNYNRLYILAASTSRDMKCTFKVDGTDYPAVVPYYGGFVGQWGHTGHTEGFLKSAEVAYVGTHKHSIIKNADLPYEFTYMFCIGLDIPEGAQTLVLPDNPQVAVFAASVASDRNNLAVPASDLLRVSLPEPEAGEALGSMGNLLEGKPVIERTGQVNQSERAEAAIDGDIATKWCDISDAKPKYITVDLQKDTRIKGWSVMHAGLESLDYIAEEYSLQVKADGEADWKTVDTVYENTELETDRLGLYLLHTGKLQPAVFLCFYFCKYCPDAQGGFLQLTVLESAAVQVGFQGRFLCVEAFQVLFKLFQFPLLLV